MTSNTRSKTGEAIKMEIHRRAYGNEQPSPIQHHLCDRNNKEKVATQNMAAIVWFFLKKEMFGTAPNVGNIADHFKVSQSQLSCLITAKKFKSRPGGYVPKKRRAVAEDEQ